MRIPIFYIPKTKIRKSLYIERRYKSSKTIVPIGCDCHPAYTLQSLYIRDKSLPFDWLNVDPKYAIEYVSANIRTGFSHFLNELTFNERGQIVSGTYPYAEFMHEKTLFTNPETSKKINRRTARFIETINAGNIAYLHNVPAADIKTEDEAFVYIETVKDFLMLLKSSDSLHIYIRYDETEDLQNPIGILLIKELAKLPLQVTCYVRERKKYGIWGSRKQYANLYKQLQINLSQLFPKIYIK